MFRIIFELPLSLDSTGDEPPSSLPAPSILAGCWVSCSGAHGCQLPSRCGALHLSGFPQPAGVDWKLATWGEDVLELQQHRDFINQSVRFGALSLKMCIGGTFASFNPDPELSQGLGAA